MSWPAQLSRLSSWGVVFHPDWLIMESNSAGSNFGSHQDAMYFDGKI